MQGNLPGLPLHCFPDPRIVLWQQLFCPPGRVAHPDPPHIPQIGAQQTFDVHGTPFDGGGGADFKQGGGSLPHTRPKRAIRLTQHLFGPPGLLPQPVPPHGPQLELQQTVALQAASVVEKRTAMIHAISAVGAKTFFFILGNRFERYSSALRWKSVFASQMTGFVSWCAPDRAYIRQKVPRIWMHSCNTPSKCMDYRPQSPYPCALAKNIELLAQSTCKEKFWWQSGYDRRSSGNVVWDYTYLITVMDKMNTFYEVPLTMLDPFASYAYAS